MFAHESQPRATWWAGLTSPDVPAGRASRTRLREGSLVGRRRESLRPDPLIVGKRRFVWDGKHEFMNHGVYSKDFSREHGDRPVCLARFYLYVRSLSRSLCCLSNTGHTVCRQSKSVIYFEAEGFGLPCTAWAGSGLLVKSC
jgi:hypothetical protein